MVEWAVSGSRLGGFGKGGSTVVDVEEWRPGSGAPAPTERVDVELEGRANAIRLPDGEVVRSSFRSEIPRGESISNVVVRITVDSDPETHLSFEGPATVDTSEPPWFRFPEPTPVSVGFRESLQPRSEVSVPATAAGLATAVSAAGRTHVTTGPERSHPGFRPRTPRVTFGDEAVPDSLQTRGDETVVTVPDSVPAVLVAAPLAYYLGAALRIESGPPTVRGEGLEHTFGPLPSFAGEVSDAVRCLCYLDGHLRSIAGETGRSPIEYPDGLGSDSPAERLAAVLRSPPETLPEWPLSTYVNDDATNGRYLPYLLDRLSLVHPASASSLDPQSLLKRSLDEFYRGGAPTVEAVEPSLDDSRFHAWLGDGTPVEAYTLLGDPDSAPKPAGNTRIDVVCNDPEMVAERSVADVYRSRLADADVTVQVHERLSTDELAAVFERRTDLVHFVGHCEVDGMCCPDGTLAADEIDDLSATSFFLNACGSYYEGYELVRRGSIVGAVTLTPVLDEQAVTLGTTFAELLTAGFAFDRALALARGEIIVGQDYVVVGDGTHRLRPPSVPTGVLTLTESGPDSFVVEYDAVAPDSAGKRVPNFLDDGDALVGDARPATLERHATAELLDRLSVPVRYGGELRWSRKLASIIEARGRQS